MKIKKILITTCILITIPLIGCISYSKNNSFPYSSIENTDSRNILQKKVKIIKNDNIKEITMEEYLIGVIAAEISPTYQIEAIKAQVIAAHTYALNRYGETGPFPTNPNIFQAYINKEQRQNKYKNNFEKYENTFQDAVNSVANKIITYNNLPIKAVFHHMSAGKTESSNNVWGGNIPYLVEADSSLETNLQNFHQKVIVSVNELYNNIKKEFPNAVTSNIKQNEIAILSKSQSGYVQSIKIFNVELSGTKLRSILKLPSANFDVSLENDNVIFDCKGMGHGVGMSQCGANELANQGKSYEEILKHYYNGVSITSL